jgi:hypothetical protein
MKYEADLEKARTEYEATLKRHEQEQLAMEDRQEKEISALVKRVEALETLIRLDYPHPDGYIDARTATPGQIHVAVTKPRLTDAIRRILAESDGPLTSPEIRERLQHTGSYRYKWKTDKGNPWAMIHSVCRNLVRQGQAREVPKGKQKAWEWVR